MRKKQILLVEDDPFLIDIYVRKLNQAGYDIIIAKDGEKALKMLEERVFDLLILDIVLPKLEGWEVLRRIKDNPKLKNLKIIILSNLGQKEEVEKGREMGAAKYLIKSQFTPSEVVEEIRKIIR